MRFLRFIVIFTTILHISFFMTHTPTTVHAVDPFAPFSVEGNPPEDYYYDKIFPLFRYIKPAALEVHENRDRSRIYAKVEICKPESTSDQRDYYCDNGDTPEGDCTGGPVSMCYKDSGAFAYTAKSTSGSCRYTKNKNEWIDDEFVTGRCLYKQTPKISSELKATDFSRNGTVSSGQSSTSDTSITVPDYTGVVYNKRQREDFYYSGIGSDNPITWGTLRLSLTQDDQIIKQVLVLARSAQTRDTLANTGEWPLGWVDWGYITNNGKTLDQIYQSLPGGIVSSARAIVESSDDFFLNAGSVEVVSDVRQAREYVLRAVGDAAMQNPQPAWLGDLLQTPLYPPSFRQGYARASICVWDICCPGDKCPNNIAFEGNSKGIYADISVSQAFGAALDDLLLNYNLKEGVKIFRELAQVNPLIRFAGSASANATPTAIHERLTREINNECIKYVQSPAKFTLGWFGRYMDYANPPTYLDDKEECPGWAIQPELTQEKGGALPTSVLAKLVSLVWGGKQVDDVDDIKYHLITIPDAMGQFLSEIEDPVFQIQDTLEENKKSNEYNAGISNIVDATSDYLTAGKGIPVGVQKRNLGYLTCYDPDYSDPMPTSIEAYALGTRIGCFQASTTGGACDGARWNEVIGDTDEMPLPGAVETVMNSKMFVNGQLNPDLAQAYAQVEEETGIPCEVLAGHHFAEGFNSFFGDNNPAEFSAANGGRVGKSGFLESVRNSAKGVLRHPPTSLETFITEASRYNGGGNSNCQLGFTGGTIPYTGCPRQFEGEDDPYAVNLLDARHASMYLLYCDDFVACSPPKIYDNRPGVVPTALVVHNAIKNSATNTSPSPSPSSTSSSNEGGGALKVDPAGSCGVGFIDTGLGCIPYERDAFISALLSFMVGISGLIALGTMLMATIQIMISGADKKKLGHGRELFTAGFTGLLFIIFAVSLLRIIAGDIIKLPGF